MSRHSRLILTAGLGVTVMLATACSSGSSTTSNPGSNTTGNTTASSPASGGQKATGSVIKIGFLLAETGPYASSTAPGLPVAEAWASWVNANGGIAGGHQVEIDAADSMGDATAGQAAATKLITQDNVDAIIVGDPVAEYAVEPYLKTIDIAKLSESGYAYFWHSDPKWFMTSTDSALSQGQAVPPGKTLGLKTFAMAVCSEVASCQSTGVAYTIPLAVSLGMKGAGFLKVSETQTDFTAACLALKQKGVDYLYFSVPPATSARMAAQCLAQGYTGYFGVSATGWDFKSLTAVKGLKAAGGINGFPWWANNAPVQTFRDVIQKYQPGADYENAASTATWTTLELLRKALSTTTGAVTRDTVLNALYKVKDETLGGLAPQPLTFTAGKPSPDVTCYWGFKVVAGEANPTSLPAVSTSGNNGASGDLASSCLPAYAFPK